MNSVVQLEFDFSYNDYKEDFDNYDDIAKGTNSAVNRINPSDFHLISLLSQNPLIHNVKSTQRNSRVEISIQFKSSNKKSIVFTASTEIYYADEYEVRQISDFILNRFLTKNVKTLLKKYQIYPACHRTINKQSPQGRDYNLQIIFDKLNKLYFNGKLKHTIVWTKKRSSRGKRKVPRYLRLGFFCKGCTSIFINSVLDNSKVSPELLEVVVYHEMIHAYLYDKYLILKKPHGKEFFELLYRHPMAKRVESEIRSGNLINKLFYIQKCKK